MVHVSSRSSRKETTNVDGGVQVHRLSAEIGSTSGTAAINGSQRVARTIIAQFAKEMIDNSITAVGKCAVGSAGIRGIEVVGGTIIALFTSINNSVTTFGKLTVETAAARKSIGVERASITNFTRVNTSITALGLATSRTTITISIVTVITSLTAKGINDTITALGDTAPRSAGIRFVSIQRTVITFFQGIQNTITTCPQSAIRSASIGNRIGIEDTIIAFLTDIKETVATNDLTALAINVGSALITSLTVISNIVSAARKLAVKTTSIRNSVGVSRAVITSFVGRSINHSIATQPSAGSVVA